MSDREGGPRWQPSAEDMKAFTDARIAALKAGLELTPER
jgi:zinc resistance-associated protein